MISFFKNLDVLRIIALLLLLILIRLPVLITGYPLLVPELNWMLIGERMSEGFMLYKETWDYLGPLSAFVYQIINAIAGKSQTAYQIISILLVFLQAIIFGLIINQNNLFRERTFLPSFLYVVFSSLFFDFYTLSPVMLGTTFLLFATHLLMHQLKTIEEDEYMFYCGLFTGIASLFYLPLAIFLIFFILSMSMFANSRLKRIFLMFLGWLFPFVVTMTWFFWKDGLDDFYYNLILPFFTSNAVNYISKKGLIIPMIIPVTILIFSFFLILTKSNYINYQYNIIKIMVLWLLFSFLTLFLTLSFMPSQLFIFMPPLAFFAAHYFHLVKNNKVRELSFLVFFIIILFINYGVLYKFAFRKNPINIEALLIKETAFPYINKKILVLGSDMSYYHKNTLATPYLNWQLSQRHFANLNNYRVLSEVYENFMLDMPDVIVDLEGKAEELFQKIPTLGTEYKLEEGNIYTRRK